MADKRRKPSGVSYSLTIVCAVVLGYNKAKIIKVKCFGSRFAAAERLMLSAKAQAMTEAAEYIEGG